MSKKMTLSALIRLIAGKKNDMATWGGRLSNSNISVKGKKVSYTFEECASNLAKARADLIRAKAILQVANANNWISYHEVGESEDKTSETKKISLAEAILTLAECKAEIALLTSLRCLESHSETTQTFDGYGNERKVINIEHICSVTIREKDSKIEFLQQKFNAINAALEAQNHLITVEF